MHRTDNIADNFSVWTRMVTFRCEDFIEQRRLCLFGLYINQIQFTRLISLRSNKINIQYNFESLKKIVIAMITF